MSSKGKPARLQVDPDTIDESDKPPQTGHTFNIWFLKWAGGDSSSRNYTKLKFRVDIKRDSGYTKGVENKSPICIFFAKGCCYKGKKCPFLHRLPSPEDHRIPTQDCFGRDKTADYRDDMAGVGSLARTNRTLYVAGINMGDHIEDVLSANFGEFGSIDKIKVLYGKGCAFISYKYEAEAQFAKESMDAQSLTGNDVLSVKWANEDPNPNAQEDTKRLLEEAAMDTVKRLLGDDLEEPDRQGKHKRQKREARPDLNKNLRKDSEDKLQEADESEVTSPEPNGILEARQLSALKTVKLRVPVPADVAKVLNKNYSALTEYSSDEY